MMTKYPAPKNYREALRRVDMLFNQALATMDDSPDLSAEYAREGVAMASEAYMQSYSSAKIMGMKNSWNPPAMTQKSVLRLLDEIIDGGKRETQPPWTRHQMQDELREKFKKVISESDALIKDNRGAIMLVGRMGGLYSAALSAAGLAGKISATPVEIPLAMQSTVKPRNYGKLTLRQTK